ncbi:UDP-N-acetylglucosamine 1-carboxyvinyltransferase [candidate division WS5 bacterium]|uniref:UDP-N-acetylglucosamine 1-carboxyvinyltransferase n=1 Tax=candidate division WS5 bacterium TaxID=2093353 RepID=A0A419D9Y2_9BACT|nr:MAG: UDP-N-acetylglucosamine 1-carboxyvinyltransferase [candidate division WS5 bacterium]
MSKIIIEGPARLKGKVKISGSKNAALPIICATLLTKGKNTLENVPNIADIHNLLKIIEKLGSKIKFEGNTLEIDNTNINGNDPDEDLVRNIRASILLIGPLLSRNKKVKISAPGGCFIGNRPLNDHFEAFEKLGASIKERGDIYTLHTSQFVGRDITLSLMSVTATENIIMASVLAKGTTRLHLASCEPHVQDLCKFLNKAGAKISGIGTNSLTIKGVKKLKPVKYSVISDEIEAGTYIIAAAATGSEITLENINTSAMTCSILPRLKEAGVNMDVERNSICVKKSTSLKPIQKIWTAPAPHFPSDLQAPFAVLMTQASGSTLIHETMYEGRLNYTKELKKMGANAFILDPHRAVIIGPTPLFGKKITTLDLRAGATLIIAALIAEGESEITHAEIIDRGYENIVEKLHGLGAKITRI